MGKGDKKTKRGKIVIGSSGIKRAKKKRRSVGMKNEVSQAAAPAVTAKNEVVKDEKPEITEAPEVKAQSPKPKKKPESDIPAAE